jgi:signal transduction histidine kinase
LSPGEGAHWLAAAAAFGTAQGVGYAALRVVLEDEIRVRPGWMLFSQVVVAAVLCLMLAMPGRLRMPVDPVVLGLSLALVITGARLVVMDRMPLAPVLQDLTPALGLTLTVLYGLMAAMLTLRPSVPEWAAWRLAVVVASLGLAQVLTYPVPVDGWRSVVVVTLDVGGAALLAMTSLELVRTAVRRTDAAEEEVRRLEAHVRDDRTLIHEVAGTVAGISAASRLLSLPAGLDGHERRALEDLLVAETARVDRLLTASATVDDLADVDLDELIDSVLFAHGIRGRLVAWHPTGDHVLARSDHLREVLDLLLDNAARHAQSPVLAVTVDRRGDQVEVAVVDQGPGIPPEIAASVLEWGTHGTASNGQGIGLNVAHRLVTAMGGCLRIESDGDEGTRVAVILPVVEAARADRPA